MNMAVLNVKLGAKLHIEQGTHKPAGLDINE